MRRKQILIGLFALIINRTIGEPKSLQGGTERVFVTMCFFQAVTGGTGISGVVFAWAVTGGTSANGLISVNNAGSQGFKNVQNFEALIHS